MKLRAYKLTRQGTAGAVILTNRIINNTKQNYLYCYFFTKSGSWYNYNCGILVDINDIDINEYSEPVYIRISKKEYIDLMSLYDHRAITAALKEGEAVCSQ